MTCNPHRYGRDEVRCYVCKKPRPPLVECRDQPMRAPIRAREGAGAYGRTAERDAVDWAKKRAGDS